MAAVDCMIKLKKRTKNNNRAITALIFLLFSFPSLSSDLAPDLDLFSATYEQISELQLTNDINNIAVIDQLGAGNNLVLAQQGKGNIAIIEQLGIDNELSLSQFGVGNRARLMQYNSGNELVLIQEGNRNTANIEQHGNQSISLHQRGDGTIFNIIQY